METSATALILVDHGSRAAVANQLVHELCRSISSTSGDRFVTVQPAHMELAAPSIAEAVERCVEAGARKIVVSLVFLAAGRHATEDVPALVQEALRDFPSVAWTVSSPLGTHPHLVDALLSRIDEALVPEDKQGALLRAT